MEMIQPNKMEQALAELGNQIFSNGFEVPTEINEKEAKYYYVCIGVKARNSKDNFSKIYIGARLFATVKKWNQMKRQVKQGIFKREFGDQYDKIILLHDPMLPQVKKVEEVKDLSPKQKGNVNKLVEEGLSIESISKELTLDIKRIKAYLK